MILGILLKRNPGPAGPFGAHSAFVRRIAQAAKGLGLTAVAFDPAAADLESGLIPKAIIPTEQGWSRAAVRLPDVVWDRTFQWGDEHLQQFLKRKVPLFNRRRLDKWEAHRLLAGSPAVRAHLPETRLLSHPDTLYEMLDHHPLLFIKPAAGSVGRGIIQAKRDGVGLVRLLYISAETGRLREVFASRDQIARWLDRRPGPYVIQQGLDLSIWEGRPADLRALIQKDGAGRWQVTGMGARIALPGRFTTNLHTGGQGAPVGRLLRQIGRPDLTDALQKTALEIARTLDAGAGPFGELGLDFGLDRSGRIWLIEQNGQPGRSIFEHLSQKDLWELAHRRPAQYAAFLARSRKKES